MRKPDDQNGEVVNPVHGFATKQIAPKPRNVEPLMRRALYSNVIKI
jgi:hypothetical protein